MIDTAINKKALDALKKGARLCTLMRSGIKEYKARYLLKWLLQLDLVSVDENKVYTWCGTDAEAERFVKYYGDCNWNFQRVEELMEPGVWYTQVELETKLERTVRRTIYRLLREEIVERKVSPEYKTKKKFLYRLKEANNVEIENNTPQG